MRKIAIKGPYINTSLGVYRCNKRDILIFTKGNRKNGILEIFCYFRKFCFFFTPDEILVISSSESTYFTRIVPSSADVAKIGFLKEMNLIKADLVFRENYESLTPNSISVIGFL